MNIRWHYLLSIVFGPVLMSGCASINQTAQSSDELIAAELSRLNVVQGDPVRSISDFRINGWHSIDEHNLILTAGRHEHYLVELSHRCPELRHAFRIGLSTRTGTLTRMDSIVVNSMHEALGQCRIREIYRLEDRGEGES